ncbi:MAG: hypothetical protein FJ014_03075 [Chloroflexi bacterium]|nr:hypothetical protein [Chloroflexota bacterium]
MVEDRPILQLKHHWFPTRASGERSFLMRLEFSVNQRSEGNEPSMAEVACSSGDIERALSIFPSFVPGKVRRELRRLLRPWPTGRYTEAYRRSGGILNLFTPPWGEEEDEVWAAMLSRWEAQPFADANEKKAAYLALEQQWNTTPHPFFAGLTPVQVMVGGGPQEAELAEEFLDRLTRECEGKPFVSEGEALVKTLMWLRGWQCQPLWSGQTPFEIIVAERNELVARRTRALAQRISVREGHDSP